jgi:hypothetical protein
MSVHNWEENPKGLWTIKIMDNVYFISFYDDFYPYEDYLD